LWIAEYFEMSLLNWVNFVVKCSKLNVGISEYLEMSLLNWVNFVIKYGLPSVELVVNFIIKYGLESVELVLIYYSVSL